MPENSTITIFFIAYFAGAYLIGSIPSGLIAVRLIGGKDPRKAGSGNIGATNVSRTSGKAAGIVTLIGDALKGALPVYVVTTLTPDIMIASITALLAFLGHLFPIYLKFKGGKGVATALGIMLVISPIAIALSVLIFVILVLITRYVSIGSMGAAIAMPVTLSFIGGDKYYILLTGVIATLIIVKHTANIKRILHGAEHKVGKQD
jgi:glycerol-3-phosphate acyltransferase PlsY